MRERVIVLGGKVFHVSVPSSIKDKDLDIVTEKELRKMTLRELSLKIKELQKDPKFRKEMREWIKTL